MQHSFWFGVWLEIETNSRSCYPGQNKSAAQLRQQKLRWDKSYRAKKKKKTNKSNFFLTSTITNWEKKIDLKKKRRKNQTKYSLLGQTSFSKSSPASYCSLPISLTALPTHVVVTKVALASEPLGLLNKWSIIGFNKNLIDQLLKYGCLFWKNISDIVNLGDNGDDDDGNECICCNCFGMCGGLHAYMLEIEGFDGGCLWKWVHSRVPTTTR